MKIMTPSSSEDGSWQKDVCKRHQTTLEEGRKYTFQFRSVGKAKVGAPISPCWCSFLLMLNYCSMVSLYLIFWQSSRRRCRSNSRSQDSFFSVQCRPCRQFAAVSRYDRTLRLGGVVRYKLSKKQYTQYIGKITFLFSSCGPSISANKQAPPWYKPSTFISSFFKSFTHKKKVMFRLEKWKLREPCWPSGTV